MKQREHKGASLIDFPDEYICLDVETTGLDFENDEIIEITALHVKDGSILDKFSTLVKPRPYETYDDDSDSYYFEYVSNFITELTGISNEMLKTAPDPENVFPAFYEFIGESVLVGHNVNFDINFIYDAFENCGLKLCNDFIDTMRIARKALPELKHHRLRDIASYFSITQDCTHRAEADANTTFLCFGELKSLVLATRSIEEFREEFKPKKNYNYKKSLEGIAPTVEEIDETNPFFGKVVVFTGALSSMPRREAFQSVVNLGGIPENRITQKTNFLIVGSEEFAASVKNGKTSKMKKADEYKLKGQDISVFSELTFFEMLK